MWGDEFEVINRDSGEVAGSAIIIEIRKKRLGEITDEDFEFSHYKHETPQELLDHYRDIYGSGVTFDTEVKMIRFRLI